MEEIVDMLGLLPLESVSVTELVIGATIMVDNVGWVDVLGVDIGLESDVEKEKEIEEEEEEGEGEEEEVLLVVVDVNVVDS